MKILKLKLQIKYLNILIQLQSFQTRDDYLQVAWMWLIAVYKFKFFVFLYSIEIGIFTSLGFTKSQFYKKDYVISIVIRKAHRKKNWKRFKLVEIKIAFECATIGD